MIDYRRQRGSLMIVTIVMILVLGFMGVAITSMSATSTYNAIDDMAANEAFYLAESGLQRGIREWSLDQGYTGEGPTNFGNGSFTIAAPIILSATQAQINATATVPTVNGNVTRTVTATVDLGGPLASNLTDDVNIWPTEVLTNNEGNFAAVSGGLRFRTDNSNGADYAGYRETGTAPPAITLNEGDTINLDLEYKKRWTGGGANPSSMDMALELVSTTGTSYVIWSENTIFNNNNWLTAPTTSWTVPTGVTINRIRLSFDLQRNGNGRRPQVLFRNIIINSAGGGGASIVSWQEDIP